MHEIDGIRWNYFTASHSNGVVNIYPGEGDYRWEDLRDYLCKVTWDNTTLLAEDGRKEIKDSLENIPENCGVTYTYPDDHSGRRMVCLYGYDEDDDPRNAAMAIFANLSSETYHVFGLSGMYIVDVPDVSDEVTEILGRIELRISLLHEEAGFPRESPVLWPSERKLLDMYNAVEENFNAVKAIALLPVFSDEIRHEACALTYAIASALRNDLYAKALAEGVPLRGDPYLSWTSRTNQSKGW